MTELSDRIKDAVSASVSDVGPPADLMAAVYARHRRGRRMRAAIGAAAAMAVLAGALALAAQPWHSTRPAVTGRQHAHAALFPGGGRMLLLSGGRLRWLRPDGEVARIAGRFSGARVTAGEILAWKYGGTGAGYYTMTLSGKQQRRVLPMAWNARVSVIQAQLSPDRAMLAYVRQDIKSATSVTVTLWIKDLATGRSVSAGRIASDGLAWSDPRTLLATSADGHSLVSVDPATGSRRSFLRATDPAVTRAYHRVRPGAGPPGLVRADSAPSPGWSGRLAVWVAAAGPSPGFPADGSFADPAEIILAGRSVVAAYAPPTPSELGLTWGPGGLFALQTGAGDKPGSWHAYVGRAGAAHPGRLSAGVPYGQNGVIFSAGGNVLALDDSGMETLVPVPRPACNAAGLMPCLAFRPMVLPRAGVIQAWLP